MTDELTCGRMECGIYGALLKRSAKDLELIGAGPNSRALKPRLHKAEVLLQLPAGAPGKTPAADVRGALQSLPAKNELGCARSSPPCRPIPHVFIFLISMHELEQGGNWKGGRNIAPGIAVHRGACRGGCPPQPGLPGSGTTQRKTGGLSVVRRAVGDMTLKCTREKAFDIDMGVGRENGFEVLNRENLPKLALDRVWPHLFFWGG